MKEIDLSLVLPCYNEEGQIENAVIEYIEELKKTGKTFEIILVNDESLDNTLTIMRKLAKKYNNIVIVNTNNHLGYGHAVRKGLEKASGKIIGWIDGDGQFDSSSIIKAYDLLNSGKYGLCKGKRIIREDGPIRFVASQVYSLLFNILFLNLLRDVHSKPKLMTKKCYESVTLTSNKWFVDSELLVKVLKKGYKVCDVPVLFKARKGGKSNVKLNTVSQLFMGLIRMRLGLEPGN